MSTHIHPSFLILTKSVPSAVALNEGLSLPVISAEQGDERLLALFIANICITVNKIIAVDEVVGEGQAATIPVHTFALSNLTGLIVHTRNDGDHHGQENQGPRINCHYTGAGCERQSAAPW